MILHTQNRHQTKPNSASSDPSKIRKNSFHWRSDSGELDVFEAARYFSAANDHLQPFINGVNFVTDPNRHHLPRRSLDVTIMRSNPIPPDYHHQMTDQKQPIKDQSKKFKQPSSPGGRLASFLNSLFNQTSLKKKKKKSSKSSTKDLEEESPGGRRKRRSSMSHFRITGTAKNAAAAEIGSGFRTPPTYVITPTKSHKELARFSDRHHQAVSGTGLKQSLEKLRVSEKMNLKKLSEEEDGAESDSSSDLFDLPNHELDCFSSSLPVYETTHMESIRIATPISSAT
ncbi:protein BIG GRAIN 1-like E [Salvia divinorum]|uniref:Protein BIG GRAIN 1-like E n=1 Tax=Salvia divinorum TaxID=28513 RepID=A0ABD1IIK2_SALDI